MSIGVRLHDTAPGTFEERVQFARAQGFDCTHLALSKVMGPAYMEPSVLTAGLASYVAKTLDGMDAAVLGCYLNLAHPDEAAYQRMLERYIAHLRLATWLKVGVVGTETGNPNAEYKYDPERSHSEESLELFIRRVRPVVEAAEKLGVIFAIEPVFNHIVSDAKRTRRVLDAFHSPNLQVILDPVNLINKANLNRRDEVIAEAIDLLGDDTQVLHMKDYVIAGDDCRACAAGTGEMDYTAIAAFIKRKPHMFITLENTTPDTAVAAARFVAGLSD